MRNHSGKLRTVLGFALICGVASTQAMGGAAAAPPGHLTWASNIALNVTPANNAYGSNPTIVTWPGVAGASIYSNRSECSPFVTRVLMQAYGWTSSYFTTWMASTSPTSAKYHDAIIAQNRFARIKNVTQIAAGDILAVKYIVPEPGSTGHMMIAAATPTSRTATAPLVAGTTQYEIKVIDSSKSGHGATDTRRRADGTYEDGVGQGVLRLYADVNGAVIGYSWSIASNSTYYAAAVRPLVVGRL